MTYQPTDADLAVLREAAEWIRCCDQSGAHARWTISAFGWLSTAVDDDIIFERPYAADFEHALRERLVADGWQVNLYRDPDGTKWDVDVDRDNKPCGCALHKSPLLALAHAAKRAGAFRKEEA